MNEAKLYNGITQIDDALIEEALAVRPKRKAAWVRWGAAAACVCVVAAGVFVWQHQGRDAPDVSETVGGETANELMTEAENVFVPPWEDMSDAERYQTLDFDGRQYMRGRAHESGAALGAALGTGEFSGWDEYAQERHTIRETVYAIDGVSTDCAVLASLDSQPYAFVNAEYKPATLGQFIDDLNLTETLEFGTAYYSSYASDVAMRSGREDFDGRLVWDYLLNHSDAANVEDFDRTRFGRQFFDISVNIPALGYQNIALWVTEDGYLCTNILETGKAFYIGEDAVQAFLDAVEETYGDRIELFSPVPAPVPAGGETEGRSTPAATPMPATVTPG